MDEKQEVEWLATMAKGNSGLPILFECLIMNMLLETQRLVDFIFYVSLQV